MTDPRLLDTIHFHRCDCGEEWVCSQRLCQPSRADECLPCQYATLKEWQSNYQPRSVPQEDVR